VDDPAKKLSELTEHLMSKQRHIETLESEKSALQLRLETLSHEVQTVRLTIFDIRKRYICINF